MKSRGKIAQKMKQSQFRHIQRELRRLLKRSAPNCSNNRTLTLDIGPVGICALDCDVCDVRFKDRAPACPDWTVRHEKEQIKTSLKEFFKTSTVEEIAVRFPDVATLLWALAEDAEEARSTPLIPEATSLGFFGTRVWVDTAEDLDALEESLKPVITRLEVLKTVAALLEVSEESAAEALSDMKEHWKGKAGLEGELADALERVGELERAVVKAPLSWWRRLWPF